MKKITTNEERPSKWSLVLNNPADNSVGLSCKYILAQLNGLYPFVAVIEHNDDINEKGEKERIHYHLILEGKRARKSTIIKSVANILNIPENCVSTKEIINFRKAVRYITHIDYPEKTLYLISDIYTNDQVYLNGFFAERIENLNEERLIEVVKVERTTSRILTKIGMEEYKKWAIVIRDLQKEIL